MRSSQTYSTPNEWGREMEEWLLRSYFEDVLREMKYEVRHRKSRSDQLRKRIFWISTCCT